METKYKILKVLKEFDRFYLAESPSGWKETFLKYEYKPNEDGYITKRKEYNYKGNPTHHASDKSLWKKGKKIYASSDYEVIYYGELMDNE